MKPFLRGFMAIVITALLAVTIFVMVALIQFLLSWLSGFVLVQLAVLAWLIVALFPAVKNFVKERA